jgi:hypothetical protein
MRLWLWGPMVVAVGQLAGCGVSGPNVLPYPTYGDDGQGGSGTTATSGTSGAGGTGGSSSHATSSGSGSGSGNGSGSGSGNGSGSGSGSGSGGGNDPACDPDPGDDACVACSKEQCCAEVAACADDDVCVCWVSCIGDGNPIDVCIGECGAPSEVLLDLLDCADAACGNECSL